MAKLKIDFVLLDESVVMNGFRSLMSGVRLESFKKNPVMLFMHDREKEVIGRWYDIRVEGDRLLAKPDFDGEDFFAERIQNKVKGGYYNAASIWIHPISVSNESELKLAGQEGPTVTEWGIFEASIVDIPNCQNAVAIRNHDGKMLQLSENNHASKNEVLKYLDSFIQKPNEMDSKFLAVKLGLDDDTDEKTLLAKVDDILHNSASFESDVDKLKADKAELEGKLQKMEDTLQSQKVDQMLDDAERSGKISEGEKEQYKKLAIVDYDTVKSLLDEKVAYEPVEGKLAAQSKKGKENKFISMDWDEIDRRNQLGVLKKDHPELYREKFDEKFKQ